MLFAAPWALLGLVFAGLPLLLHLRQRHEAPEILFPAVRYLEDTTRQQQRRFALRHRLLLLARTLLIVALVLAAAGATVRRLAMGPHAPAALVLIVDNSAASGAVVAGETALTELVHAGGAVLDHATPSDRLWLVTADGTVRTGSASELRRDLAALKSEPRWFDLGRAVTEARRLLQGSDRAGQVVVVSALPRTEVTGAIGHGDLLVIHPASAPPANHAITGLSAGLQPWSPAGGQVQITILSSDTAPVPVTLSLGRRTLRDVLVTPGTTAVERIGALSPGWTTVSASVPPDEHRLDDAASVAIRVAPPPSVRWDSTDRYIDAAAHVLAADGRIRAGDGIDVGRLGARASVVIPPDDPSRIGALNRALAARGSAWRFGALVTGSEQTDAGEYLIARDAVTRRYTLERASGESTGEVLATVEGAPWLVRSGEILLLGSRLDPQWTGLPLAAGFVPFVDAMLTTAARGTMIDAHGIVGEPIAMPARVTAIRHDSSTIRPDGSGRWIPSMPGVYHLLAGGDTVGALSIGIDPRAAALARASDADVIQAWPGALVRTVDQGPALAFATLGRGDLRGLLLIVALMSLLMEVGLSGPVARSVAPV